MAVATGLAITAGIGLAANGAKAISAANRKGDLENELNNYERQELVNAHKNRQVSTVGSDILQDQSNRTTATTVDALRQGGLRGIFGGLPKVQAYNNKTSMDIRNYLDTQQIGIDRDYAMDEARLRQIREHRDNQNIAGLSSGIDAANQDMWSGISGAANSFGSLAGGLSPQAATAGAGASSQNFFSDYKFNPNDYSING